MKTKNAARFKKEVWSHIHANTVGRGSYETCFIGCLANKDDDPGYIAENYGIPFPVTRIAESIFEGLGSDDGVKFFGEFADEFEDGKDLSLVCWKFLHASLESLPSVEDAECAKAIEVVKTGIKLLAEGGVWGYEQAADAVSAASAAANAANVANVAYAANAANVANAASAAANAAKSAASASSAAKSPSVAYAANAAANADCAKSSYRARIEQSKTLVRLISEA